MPRTIAQARTKVLRLVDDVRGERFAPTVAGVQGFSAVDSAMRDSLSACLDDLLAAGNKRFDEQLALTTTAAGLLDLGTYKLRDVRSVRVKPDTTDDTQYPLEPGDDSDGGVPDSEARDLNITVVRDFSIEQDPDADDLMLGQVDGVARSWDAFERWVLARAADELSATDNETRASVQRLLARERNSCLGAPVVPRVMPWFGSRRRATLLLAERLRWLWFPHPQRLQLMFTRGSA